MEHCRIVIVLLLLVAVTICAHQHVDGFPNDRLRNIPHDNNNFDINGQTFDFIVVGSGPAGCVLANRLSENGYHKVLLLEAGLPDNRTEIYMPAAFYTLMKTEYDWNYYNEPDPITGLRQYLPRGKTLGGSSSTNAMIVNRGNAADYDAWAALGNEGWAWKDLLPWFKRMEQNFRPSASPDAHGFSGPFKVADPTYVHNYTLTYLQTMSEVLRIPFDKDQMSAEGNPYGPAVTQVNILGGKRISFAEAYLTTDVLSRPNLFVRANAHVTKVLFEGKRAVGVTYYDKVLQRVIKVLASKEVILSAGSFNSPQLLMLSGVGPAEHLKSVGIKDIVLDLPGVGQNLQDHVIVGVTYNTTGLSTLTTEQTPQNIVANWWFRGQGPMASNVGESVSFLRSRYSPNGPSDMQIEFGPVIFVRHGFQQYPGYDGVSSGPIMMKPRSKGFVQLRSANPFDAPVIDHKYFSDPEKHDMTVLVDGVKLVRKLLKASLGRYLDTELVPGADVQTDEQIENYVRNYFMTDYHHAGTCKMGPSSDKMAVVNKDLEVYGLEGLRVVDASIMPDVIVGNPNYPIGAYTEKIADVINRKYAPTTKKDEL